MEDGGGGGFARVLSDNYFEDTLCARETRGEWLMRRVLSHSWDGEGVGQEGEQTFAQGVAWGWCSVEKRGECRWNPRNDCVINPWGGGLSQ